MGAKLHLSAPGGVCAGESLAITLVIEAPSAIDFERLEIELRGNEEWAVGSGNSRIAHAACFFDQTVTVHERGTLPAGRHEFHASFTLPSNSPPTHDTTPALVWLRGRGRMIRAFPSSDLACTSWFDLRRTTRGPIERIPTVVRIDELAVSVASRRLAIGESIVGWISTAIPHTKPLEVVVQLLASTDLLGPQNAGAPRFPWRRMTVFVPAVDQPVPFELALPTAMPPTFTSLTHARDWVLVVRTPGRLWRAGHSVQVFLEIFDVVGTQAPAPVVAPEIGRRRISAVFAEFARARDWQVHELLEHDDQLGILRPAVGRIDGQLVFELACAYGPDGMLVTARAEYPSLALGLVVEPSSPLRELLTHDIDADHPAWDRTHHVEATEPAAAAALLHAVVPELVAATSLGELLRWTDTAIVFTRAAAWLEADELARMATALDSVAHAITATLATPPQPYR